VPQIQRQPGELLRDLHLKRIDRAERGAHRGGAHADRDRCQRVEAQPPGDEQQDGHERNDFFRHVLQCAAQRERERHDRDHQRLAIGEPAHEPADPLTERARLVDDREGAADEKDEEHHRGRVREPFGNRHQRFERTNVARLDAVIRAGYDDLAARRRIVAALVFPRWKEVTADRGGENTRGQKRQGMGETGASHAARMVLPAACPERGPAARESKRPS
jgi:hypothetical protein